MIQYDIVGGISPVQLTNEWMKHLMQSRVITLVAVHIFGPKFGYDLFSREKTWSNIQISIRQALEHKFYDLVLWCPKPVYSYQWVEVVQNTT